MHAEPSRLRVVLRSKRLDPLTVALVKARICHDGELHFIRISTGSLSAERQVSAADEGRRLDAVVRQLPITHIVSWTSAIVLAVTA